MSFIKYINATLDLVYPRVCYSCNKSIRDENEKYICFKCRNKIDIKNKNRCVRCGTFIGPYAANSKSGCVMCSKVKLYFDAVHSITSYEGVMRELIHRYKYDYNECLAKPLGKILVQGLKHINVLNEMDFVIPVPLYWRRKVKRGFNQSELLAKIVAKHLSLKYSKRILIRNKNTETQTHLSRDERVVNVKNAFVVNKPSLISGKSIILVDDVMTTGVTASECAHALKGNGAALVHVIALTRVNK